MSSCDLGTGMSLVRVTIVGLKEKLISVSQKKARQKKFVENRLSLSSLDDQNSNPPFSPCLSTEIITFFASFLRLGGTSRKMKNSVFKHVFMRPGNGHVRVLRKTKRAESKQDKHTFRTSREKGAFETDETACWTGCTPNK